MVTARVEGLTTGRRLLNPMHDYVPSGGVPRDGPGCSDQTGCRLCVSTNTGGDGGKAIYEHGDPPLVPEGGCHLQPNLPKDDSGGTMQARGHQVFGSTGWQERQVLQLRPAGPMSWMHLRPCAMHGGQGQTSRDFEGHGPSHGNNKGGGAQGLTGWPGKWAGRPGSVTPPEYLPAIIVG
jgi:hypothetical protein